MRLLRAGIAVFLLLPISAHAEPPTVTERESSPIPADNRQLLLAHSASWSASSGVLDRYERGADGRWILVGTRTPVSLGRHGMAWGRGLQKPSQHGPLKKEGDGRSPAGVFALASAFGTADMLPDGARGIPYLHTRTTTYCVEDVRSDFYNRIIDARDVTPRLLQKWSELRRPDGLFDWGVIVRQNDPDIRRGAGSCVFLHIWRGPNVPTAGCTAMARETIEAILRWLNADADPVLVQLPDQELAEWRTRWTLPT